MSTPSGKRNHGAGMALSSIESADRMEARA